VKPHLLFRDRGFELPAQPRSAARDTHEGAPAAASAQEATLGQDLALDTVWSAMAGGDKFLWDVARSLMLASLNQPEAILYRQAVVADSLARPKVIRQLYALTTEVLEREKSIWTALSGRYPAGVLYRSVDLLKLLVPVLRQLRLLAVEHDSGFRSEGFRTFFKMLAQELDEQYLGTLEEHARRLRLRDGVLLSAELGAGNRGCGYIMRRPQTSHRSWMQRLQDKAEHLLFHDSSKFIYQVADRDETGMNALSELQSRGIAPVARASGQATDHLLDFFRLLRAELGFLIGCVNLHDCLSQKGEPTCMPEPLPPSTAVMWSVAGLYDLALSLNMPGRVVGNDVEANRKCLIMVTGANRGGKSTFLRSVGQAQLMMQAGMFVPAMSFSASICTGLFTHFRREEDVQMRSGKLDEELRRMSAIVLRVRPSGVLLLNESFSSTNEREGSEIGGQIVQALLEGGVKVVYVTHLFDLAHRFYEQHRDDALFLRAQRHDDGARTFRLIQGEPLATSHGSDLYTKIFGQAAFTDAVSSRIIILPVRASRRC
jgi:hypothetical protein